MFVPMAKRSARPASRAVEAAPRSLSASTVAAEGGGERETCETPRPVPCRYRTVELGGLSQLPAQWLICHKDI